MWRASRGKDPRACVVNKRRVGRKEKFDYYKLFKVRVPRCKTGLCHWSLHGCVLGVIKFVIQQTTLNNDKLSLGML